MKTIAAALAVFCIVGARAATAQMPLDADPGRSERTRDDLERLLAYYEQSLESAAYSGRTRATLRARADQIRSRLENGDFQPGDRIVLYVQGETNVPDTVPVQAGPLITLPLFGDISLRGVLRSEITAHLTEQLSRFIRDPVVRAQGLMRLSVQGAVVRPGFYVVSADMLLSEALMSAGGPAVNADVNDVRIERGANVLHDGQELQEAMRAGRTLDQLNLQAGDQVIMPSRGGGMLTNIGIVAGILTSVTLIIVQLSR